MEVVARERQEALLPPDAAMAVVGVASDVRASDVQDKPVPLAYLATVVYYSRRCA